VNRKFLLKLRLWTQLVIARRRWRRVRRSVAEIKRAHEKELLSVRSHYEKLLAAERLKVEALSLSISDRTLQAFNLMGVSHTVINHAEGAEANVEPGYKPLPIPEEETLIGDEHDLFLDLRDGFWEAERDNGRDEAEIKRLWDSDFKFRTIKQVKESILQ
jgi:hypothetical protein